VRPTREDKDSTDTELGGNFYSISQDHVRSCTSTNANIDNTRIIHHYLVAKQHASTGNRPGDDDIVSPVRKLSDMSRMS
jgi:hypothetical protein